MWKENEKMMVLLSIKWNKLVVFRLINKVHQWFPATNKCIRELELGYVLSGNISWFDGYFVAFYNELDCCWIMGLEDNTIHRFKVHIPPVCPTVLLRFFNFASNVSYVALQYRDREMTSVCRTEAFVAKAGTNNEDIWRLWKKKG